MLTHPTTERLRGLGLAATAQALEEQRRQPDLDGLGFDERLALLVDREATERDDWRMRARLKFAGLRQSACVEDIDWRAARGLDYALFQRLAAGEWIDRHHRRRQDLAGLRPRPQGLPRQPQRALPAPAAAARGPRPGTRRWALRPRAQEPGPRPAAGP